MIEAIHGKYFLTCDYCGEEHEDNPFRSFDEARVAARKDRWMTSYLKGTWINLCPECKNETTKGGVW